MSFKFQRILLKNWLSSSKIFFLYLFLILLLRGDIKNWNIEITLVPSLQIRPENIESNHPENICDIVFEKAKGLGGKVDTISDYVEAVV